jgi:hypothetical protein
MDTARSSRRCGVVQKISGAIGPRYGCGQVASGGAGLQAIGGFWTIFSVREKLVDLLEELAKPARV